MSNSYATDFFTILPTLALEETLMTRTLHLVRVCPMPGKVLEGSGRTSLFRGVLEGLISSKLNLSGAFMAVEKEIPRSSSIYSTNNRVFPVRWGERLVRTQLSRIYNQAVLEALIDDGQVLCHVPHSSHESSQSDCTRLLAGRTHELQVLYGRLLRAYSDGIWEKVVKIPDHPHCTHVVCPHNR